MNRKDQLEKNYQLFDLPDALRIACEMNIDITKPEPWLRVYYDAASALGVGFVGPEWPPAFIHGLANLIQELVEDSRQDWHWDNLPLGARELYEEERAIFSRWQGS